MIYIKLKSGREDTWYTPRIVQVSEFSVYVGRWVSDGNVSEFEIDAHYDKEIVSDIRIEME